MISCLNLNAYFWVWQNLVIYNFKDGFSWKGEQIRNSSQYLLECMQISGEYVMNLLFQAFNRFQYVGIGEPLNNLYRYITANAKDLDNVMYDSAQEKTTNDIKDYNPFIENLRRNVQDVDNGTYDSDQKKTTNDIKNNNVIQELKNNAIKNYNSLRRNFIQGNINPKTTSIENIFAENNTGRKDNQNRL